MKLTPNFYYDRVRPNVLASSKGNIRDIYVAAEGHVLVDVLSENHPDAVGAVADMREYAALIDNTLSAGLGVGDPNQSAMVSEISRQIQPQHVNRVFTGVAISRTLLGQQETMVSGLVPSTGTPGRVKISTGSLSSQAPDDIMPVETTTVPPKDMGGSSIKCFPMGGLQCRDEYVMVAQTCVRHGLWLEPADSIDLDNFAEILQIASDVGMSRIIPHIYSSIIDKVNGNACPDDVRQLTAMTQVCVGQPTDEEADVRFPNQRLAQLPDTLQNEALPQGELAQRLSAFTRTVQANITTLNVLFTQHDAQPVLSWGNGYQLKIDDPASFHTLQTQQPNTLLCIPHTSQERIHWLVVRFLISAFSLKLEDLAGEWFISRAALQNDMTEVREHLQRYHLALETRPRHGMKLLGSGTATRAYLTDLLWALAQQDPQRPLMTQEALSVGLPEQLQSILQDISARFHVRLTDKGELFLCLYCMVVVRRVSEEYPLPDFIAEEVDQSVCLATWKIVVVLHRLAGKPFSVSEESRLQVYIAAHQVQEIASSATSVDDDEALVSHILRFTNSQYNYNLLDDKQLHADLLMYTKTMITRMRYQIMIPNPLLESTRQRYPMAWDMTLVAVSGWGKYTPYAISENEIDLLVLHIDVGLERGYNIGYQRQSKVLLVCDAGNAMAWMIEAILTRKCPQIEIVGTVTFRDYEQRESISEDFVISTARIGEKDEPVVVTVSFPTDRQLRQIGKLVPVDRTRPWALSKLFDAAHFHVIDKPMDQQTLLKTLRRQPQDEGSVDVELLDSVIEREAAVNTMLGDSIALSHALGLLIKRTAVYIAPVPQGIAWDDEMAHMIFLLVISKSEYEEAMVIYDIFVTFLRGRAVTRLCVCHNFAEFEAVATECVGRF